MSDGQHEVLRIERTFAAPAEAVFDAWTSAEVMRRWLHCESDWETPVADVDLRVGGTVRIAMRRPNGSESAMHGEYREIDRPNRLVMTWTFDDDAPDNEQLIELSFTQSGGETTVVMVNSRIATRARHDSQSIGWHGCLDQLAVTLAPG